MDKIDKQMLRLLYIMDLVQKIENEKQSIDVCVILNELINEGKIERIEYQFLMSILETKEKDIGLFPYLWQT